MSLPTRKIGNDDVTEIGFGAMGLSVAYGSVDSDEERFKLLDAALENGCTFWDTADVYGDNEELIGKWFERTGKRDKIFLATKFVFSDPYKGIVRGDAEYVRESVEKSLQKLKTDHIELYYLHRADSKTPIEITVTAMAELVREGKVKYIGLSEISSETLRRAHAIHPISAVQVEYSLFTLDIETEKIGLLKTCRELGVAVVAYSPLGRGLLTGQYKSLDDLEKDDFRRLVPKYQKNFDKILKLVDDIKTIADKHKATAGQVTLAWLLAQGNDIFVIPGTKKLKYLKENLDAANVRLTKEELQQIRDYAKNADVGEEDRYPPGIADTLFADTPPLSS